MKIVKHTAETVYINHPEASYGIFCYNEAGDLFCNSDWGSFMYAWRSYGKDKSFKEFLASCNADYIVGKFNINYLEMANKQMPKVKRDNLTILVSEFIKSIAVHEESASTDL